MAAKGASFLRIGNAQAADISACPVVPPPQFRDLVLSAIGNGGRLAALLAVPALAGEAGGRRLLLLAAVANPRSGDFGLVASEVGQSYPALTPDCPAAHMFEREIFEQHGIRPEGHPWLKPVRFPQPSDGTGARPNDAPRPKNVYENQSRGGCAAPNEQGKEGQRGISRADMSSEPDAAGRSSPPAAGRESFHARSKAGMVDFFRMEGDEVHEVAVGPVHAGVIEPGHFRFQCHGETVHHLEISLGYQHRGVERALAAGPNARSIHYAQTLAGDTTAGHATAYAVIVESLCQTFIPARACVIRAVAAELERIANHIGDLGALAGDVGFLPTMSYCGRIRGDALNMTALLCGNRFSRGLIAPGGVNYDISDETIQELAARMDALDRDATSAIELMFDAPSVLARLDGTGAVSEALADEIGLVGLAARASGLSRDARCEFPYGAYRFAQLPMCTWTTGDCFARAYVRWLEVRQSMDFMRDQLRAMPGGPISKPLGRTKPGAIAVAMVEGWRGEICHLAVTDQAGRFAWYKVVDPSFHNWFGLACALRQQQISDFPLCNKSFNLSYCGFDL